MTSQAVPAFLIKLKNLLDDPENDDIIAWDHSGTSFHIYDQTRLAKEVLPLYFKHNNIASFIRQLNMYGFRKVMQVEYGGIKMENEDLHFSHPYFVRGQENLLEYIKRKVPGAGVGSAVKGTDDPKVSKGDVEKVLTDVNSIKNSQKQMNLQIDSLKNENRALWREVASMRQKHQKQQQVVNKLISFLVQVVGTRGPVSSSMKRRQGPLMLENIPSDLGSASVTKIPRQANAAYDLFLPDTSANIRGTGGLTIQEVDPTSVTSPLQSPEQNVYTVQVDSPDNLNPSVSSSIQVESPDILASALSSSGASKVGLDPNTFLSTSGTLISPGVVRNAEDLLDDPAVIANARENLGNQAMNDIVKGVSSSLQQPVFPEKKVLKKSQEKSRKLKSNLKLEIPKEKQEYISAPSPNTINENALEQLAMAIPSKSVKDSPFTPEVLDSQLDNVQYNLDSIKDLLSYNIEPNMLTGLFDPEVPATLPENIDIFNTDESNNEEGQRRNIVGNEMIQYEKPMSDDEVEDLFDLGTINSVDPDTVDLSTSFNSNSELNTPVLSPLDAGLFPQSRNLRSSAKKKNRPMEEVD